MAKTVSIRCSDNGDPVQIFTARPNSSLKLKIIVKILEEYFTLDLELCIQNFGVSEEDFKIPYTEKPRYKFHTKHI